MADLTPKQSRRLFKQLDDQMALERNGAPPPPEIANRMTKIAEPELYQVWAEPVGEHIAVPLGPRWRKSSAEQLCEAISRMIMAGKEKRYSNPHVLPCILLSTTDALGSA